MDGGDVAAGRWVVAPAKLTVSLRVLRRRPDGYHDLEAEMVSLDLADRLWIDPSGDGLEIVADANARAAGLDAGPDNLVRRALRAVDRHAAIQLHKQIPVQGGLGGGSTDAAAILRWAGCTDLAVAAGLGADVPFCLAGGRAVVTGLGDEVSSQPFEPRTFGLLLPPFGVSTVDAYGAWDQQASDRQGRGGQASDRPGPDRADAGVNDLTVPALSVEPRLARWRDRLGALTGREPVLAGSGSTWFVDLGPGDTAVEDQPVDVDGERGRMIVARAVPASWDGVALEKG
ncbi:MAG TPA: 4-(cytidine 5'-diphospho)-2-C-methyl-D-erythritol kinase [Acidimicrobiales bacterium]|nr:4-(cytidine 5'-diphospho)-2-C-methyl-D-erythritol kinase [Acidimicrobiales bacterium]